MNIPRIVGEPQPGFFKIKFKKGGAFIPARISRECQCTIKNGLHEWSIDCDRYPRLVAIIDGKRPVKTERSIEMIWLTGQVIDETEYNFLLADNEWMKENEPEEIAREEPMPLTEMKPIF